MTTLDDPPLYYFPYTYAVTGAIAVASGATNYLPPFFYPCIGGQQVELYAVRGKTRSGSLTLDIQQNGSGITGLTSLSFSTTVSTYYPSSQIVVGDGDYFSPFIDTITSTPDGLSLTFIFSIWLEQNV